jgi:hypothetical protein
LKYREALHEQLQYHAVFDKSKALLEAASKKQWTESHTADYEKLDIVITQASAGNTQNNFTGHQH